MNRVILKYTSMLLVCLSFVNCSCSFFIRERRTEYENFYNTGGKYIREGKFDKAEESYTSALDIAQKQNWPSQIVATKQRLAEVYLATNRYDKTKDELLEARDICLSNEDCSSGLLGSVYDYLIFLSLAKEGDVSTTEKYIDQVISQRERLEKDKDEDFKKRLLGYAENLKSAGFEQESKEIIKKANSMPISK